MKLLFAAFVFAVGANAHYYIDAVNGGNVDSMRPVVTVPYTDSNPVTGSQITTEDIVCNVARPFNAKAPKPITIAAGSTLSFHWTSSMSGHPGPCHVYIGQGMKPTGWSKLYEQYATPKWCSEMIDENGGNLKITIPPQLAPGEYVLSVQQIGLHLAFSAGGAQFYIRCVDIIVTGSGTQKPPFEIKLPGAFDGSTPGVLYPLYSTSAAEYPRWGGSLWIPGSSTGGTSQSPARSATSPTRSATPSSTPSATSPSPTNCVAKLNQCGGSNYKGVTCCQSGSTCKVVNQYYSQCQ